MRAIIAGFLAASLFAGAASAATIGEAKAAFSADRVLIVDNKPYQGKMWSTPGAERHEQNLNGIPAAFVLHSDNPLAELVLPQLHTVVNFLLPAELRLFDDPKLNRRPLGQETIAGVPTTKYAIEVTGSEGHGEGTLWMSANGIPMRLDGNFTRTNGKSGHLHWELSNVRFGPQPANLFEAPHGYSKLPAEAIVPLLGLKLKGAHE